MSRNDHLKMYVFFSLFTPYLLYKWKFTSKYPYPNSIKTSHSISTNHMEIISIYEWLQNPLHNTKENRYTQRYHIDHEPYLHYHIYIITFPFTKQVSSIWENLCVWETVNFRIRQNKYLLCNRETPAPIFRKDVERQSKNITYRHGRFGNHNAS